MIAFNKRNSTMDCRVRDFSCTGARVHLTNTAVIPDQFDLTIARKERSFRARMVWRSVDEAGVTFLGDNEMLVSLDLARRLRQSENNNSKSGGRGLRRGGGISGADRVRGRSQRK